MILAKFCEDISTNKKSFPYKDMILIVQFMWQLYAVVVRYRQFRQMSSFLGRKGRVKNFNDFSKTEGQVHVYTYIPVEGIKIRNF